MLEKVLLRYFPAPPRRCVILSTAILSYVSYVFVTKSGMTLNLTDQQLTQFLDLGYLILNLQSVSAALHDELFEEARALYSMHAQVKDKRTGLHLIADNLTARSRLLREIVDAPEVGGALGDILGHDYYRYSHSFIHQSNASDQTFHKDSTYPWGLRAGLRSHRPNWAMVFYYPQETTVELGPTYIVPGSQYWNVNHEYNGNVYGEDRLNIDSQQTQNPDAYDLELAQSVKALDERLEAFPVLVPKGAVLIVHFDLFHRGSRQQSAQQRFMYKFWYVRTMEPRPRPFKLEKITDSRRFSAAAKVGEWLTRSPCAVATSSDLEPSDEASRLDRALRLGKDPCLLEELQSNTEDKRRAAMYGLSNTGTFASKTATEALNHPHWGVRKSSAFVLGEIGLFSKKVIDALSRCANDIDERKETRSTAITSIGRIGRKMIADGRLETLDTLLDAVENTTSAPIESESQRSIVPMSRLQQSSALALLMITTESIAGRVNAVALNRLSDIASNMAASKLDRYAQSTAIECCRRLSRLGIESSINILIRHTEHSRWIAD